MNGVVKEHLSRFRLDVATGLPFPEREPTHFQPLLGLVRRVKRNARLDAGRLSSRERLFAHRYSASKGFLFTAICERRNE